MQLISSKTVITKKSHKCIGCNRELPKGTKMRVNTFTDGDIHHDYWCRVCDEYFDRYMEQTDFFLPGELKSEGKEDWEKTRKEIENSN